MSLHFEPLALFFADSHLDTGAWANRPALRGDSIAAFSYICDFAVENNIPAVFGAGDLIDIKKPPPEVVRLARTCIDSLADCNIEFYFTQGQHEYAPDLPWFQALHSWPQWINRRRIDLGEISVYGLDWHTGDKVAEAITSIPASTDLLIMHQVWEEFMGDKCGCECSFSQVPHASTIFTGDLHISKDVTFVGLDGQNLRVISPGSTNMRKIDEQCDKYFYVLSKDLTWVKFRIPTRQKIELNVGSERDLSLFKKTYDKALETARANNSKLGLPSSLSKPFCRVKYIDSLPDVFTMIKAAVADSAELFLRPVVAKGDVETVAVDRGAFDAAAGAGLLGMLESVVKKSDCRFKIISRLLNNSTDMRVELQRIRKDYGLTQT